MSRESHLELKVGSFVMLALVGLMYFIFSVSNLSLFEKGYGMQAVFSFANGLRDAAPVRLAGVEVGIVKAMTVFVDEAAGKKTKVRVDLWIKEGMLVPSDSKITINQLGLLGEKYVEIVPGTATDSLKAGAVVVGADPVPMEKITEKVSLLADKLETTIEGFNTGVLTEKNKKSFENILDGLSVTMSNVKQGQGTVGKFLTDESIYRNLEELTADLKANPWKLLYRPKK